MGTLFARHRNATILVAVLFAQVLGLAVQVRRPAEGGPTRLLRLWVASAVTPLERVVILSGRGFSGLWHDYVWLRGVRRENRELRAQLEHMRLEQVRLSEDAAQARRLQVLLDFKEEHIAEVVAAQVIGTSGTEQSRLLYLDKGAHDGVRPDLPVITPDGVVGKIVRVFPVSSQVLVINDASSGVGGMLENSRLQGVVKGTPAGELVLHYVMSDEKVAAGERVLTSGGDRIFPKGLPVGQVIDSSPGQDLFLNIRVKPAAALDRLEEVLVVTRVEQRKPEPGETSGPLRAADVLGQRLPGLPAQPATTTVPANGAAPAHGTAPAATPKAGEPKTKPTAPPAAGQAASPPKAKPAAPKTEAAAADVVSAQPASTPQPPRQPPPQEPPR